MYHAVVEDLGGGDAAAGIKTLVVLSSKGNTNINTTGRKLLQSAGNVIN